MKLPIYDTTSTSGYRDTSFVCVAHVDVGVEELGPGVAGQHVDDDHLAPLLHIDQEIAQLPVILVNQVDALRTNFLKCHDNTASDQLQKQKCI